MCPVNNGNDEQKNSNWEENQLDTAQIKCFIFNFSVIVLSSSDYFTITFAEVYTLEIILPRSSRLEMDIFKHNFRKASYCQVFAKINYLPVLVEF